MPRLWITKDNSDNSKIEKIEAKEEKRSVYTPKVKIIRPELITHIPPGLYSCTCLDYNDISHLNALAASGALSLGTSAGTDRSISAEFGGDAPHILAAEYYADAGNSSATETLSFSDFHGLSSWPDCVCFRGWYLECSATTGCTRFGPEQSTIDNEMYTSGDSLNGLVTIPTNWRGYQEVCLPKGCYCFVAVAPKGHCVGSNVSYHGGWGGWVGGCWEFCCDCPVRVLVGHPTPFYGGAGGTFVAYPHNDHVGSTTWPECWRPLIVAGGGAGLGPKDMSGSGQGGALTSSHHGYPSFSASNAYSATISGCGGCKGGGGAAGLWYQYYGQVRDANYTYDTGHGFCASESSTSSNRCCKLGAGGAGYYGCGGSQDYGAGGGTGGVAFTLGGSGGISTASGQSTSCQISEGGFGGGGGAFAHSGYHSFGGAGGFSGGAGKGYWGSNIITVGGAGGGSVYGFAQTSYYESNPAPVILGGYDNGYFLLRCCSEYGYVVICKV